MFFIVMFKRIIAKLMIETTNNKGIALSTLLKTYAPVFIAFIINYVRHNFYLKPSSIKYKIHAIKYS